MIEFIGFKRFGNFFLLFLGFPPTVETFVKISRVPAA